MRLTRLRNSLLVPREGWPECGDARRSKSRWACKRALVVAGAAFWANAVFWTVPALAEPQLIGVAHVALRVSDIATEVQFFNKLGFQQAFTHEQNGHTAFVFVKINDSEFIEVHPRVPEGATQPKPLGFDHICFVTTDAQAEYSKWVAEGLRPTAVAKGPDGTLEFGVKDPSGAMTEALQILPGSQPEQDKGKHLGLNRVSDWLAGIDMPVTNVAMWQDFYRKLGFAATAEGSTVRMRPGSTSDLTVVLQPKSGGEKTGLIFLVHNLQGTAAQLRKAGVSVQVAGRQLIVHDPDSNTLFFMQQPSPPSHN